MLRVGAEAQETASRLEAARRERKQAAERDRRRYAEALVEGKKKPKAAEVGRFEAEIEELEERAAALAIARQELASREGRVVSAHAEEWRLEALGGVPEAVRNLERAASELMAAASRVSSLAQLHNWLSNPGAPRRSVLSTVRMNGAGPPIGISGVVSEIVAAAQRVEAMASGAEVAREPQGAGQHA